MTSRLVLALATLVQLSLLGAAPNVPGRGQIFSTQGMNDCRADHTSTLLKDGRVLVAGGMIENGVFLNSAELFDPATGKFIFTGSMQSRRVGHTATLLPNGKVLIVGGLAGRVFEGGPGIVASTEIYDPKTGRFTAGPPMTAPRTGHAAVVLADGKVLIAGGADHDEREVATAEIYDPVSNRFIPTANMHTPRIAKAAVLLKDGRVLVTGGGNGRQAEIFDPAKVAWQQVGEMKVSRMKHAATLLSDGRVLIVGGSPDSEWHPVRSAEVFDPKTNQFTLISEMEFPRFKLPDAVTRLKNGDVLVAGGAADVEIYQAASRKFVRAGSIGEPHFFASSTLLSDGRVLIAGGYGLPNGRANGPLSTQDAWIYKP